MPLHPLPEPVAGEPTRYRPPAAKPEGAWVAMIPNGAAGPDEELYEGQHYPGVCRALSLVPDEVRTSIQVLVPAQYMEGYKVPDLARDPGRTINRTQMELVADDIHYFMPTRVNRLPQEQHLEVRAANQGAHFDDDKQRLGLRVKKLGMERNWAEYPASRTRHLITNVWISPTAQEGEYRVQSYFHFYRSRLDRQVENLVGVRDDVLRRATNPYGFELARRTIALDQTVLLSGSITTFL